MARSYAPRQRRKLMSEINVVPYIDVMLVLLVIFMITAPLLKTGVEVDLPKTQAKPVKPAFSGEPIILTINAQGAWYLNIGETPQQPIGELAALALVQKILLGQPDRTVMVRADRSVAYGQVMGGMATLQQAGARKVQLISDPSSS